MKSSKKNVRQGILFSTDELIDSDDTLPHVETSNEKDPFTEDSEEDASESEEFLLEKYNLKDFKSGSKLRNPADNLLSDPKYRGRKANVGALNLPKITADSDFSHGEEESEGDAELWDNENENEADNNPEDIFKKFKAMQKNTSEQEIPKPDLLLKRKEDLIKANCLKDQLAFMDDLFTLRILLQRFFVKPPAGNSTVLSTLLELVSILLKIHEKGINDGIGKKRTFSSIEELWSYIRQLSALKEPALLAAYDSLWSKSHSSFQKSGKDSSQKSHLKVLNQGFSASITYLLKSHQSTKGTFPHGDDSRFYQQLLKDIIDAKLSSSKSASVAKISINNLHSAKKAIHKSSKGRKLNYEIHAKLENFMAPKSLSSEWTEEKISQLFVSLPPLNSIFKV